MSSAEVSIVPVDKRWYGAHREKRTTYADRSRTFREAVPNAQEFVVMLQRKNFVPIRHLIVQAITQLDEKNTNVYAGMEGASLAKLGELSSLDYPTSADGRVFAHSLEHLSTLEALSKPMPDLKLDPFILFHLTKTQQPVVLRYDTAKLQPSEDNVTFWTPIEGETAASAVDGVFYLRPGKE